MTTLAAYCQSMGWDINDPKIKSTLGNISADTELREDQMDKLQEAMYNALGALKPGDDPMIDAFGGRRKENGNIQFKSNQDMIDYMNSTIPRKADTGSFWNSQFVQQPLAIGKAIIDGIADFGMGVWKFLTE